LPHRFVLNKYPSIIKHYLRVSAVAIKKNGDWELGIGDWELEGEKS